MTTLFWVLIVLHVFLCLFLALLVLVQNDKMGGLAGLGGMTSQSAFSTAGAATFIQKLTRVVAVLFFIVVMALSLITAKQDQVVEESTMQKATRENAAEQAGPEIPALPATFNAPAEAAPAAPAAAEEEFSSGTLKLKGCDEKTAAMIMAIVADDTGIPLSELVFKSIKLVEKK